MKSDGNSPKGYVTIPVSRLRLDLDNPRHDPVQREEEAIAELCRTEQVIEIAKDIAKIGTSPIDLLGAMEDPSHPGYYISLEGNRRTCALKLLADPSRAPFESVRKALRGITEKQGVPGMLFIYVFPDRKTANPWIERRHLGALDGRGVKSWNAKQKTRSAGKGSSSSAADNALALEVINHLRASSLITKAQHDKVPLTTISRYLTNKYVRGVFGLSSPTELRDEDIGPETNAYLQRLVLDSIPEHKGHRPVVHSRTKAADWMEYAASLKKAKLPPIPANGVKLAEKASTQTASSGVRNAPDPDRKKFLFRDDFKIPVADYALGKIRKEAVNLNLDEFPLCGVYLLRALVERVIQVFLERNGESPVSNQEQMQIRASELLKSLREHEASKFLKSASGDTVAWGLYLLGNAVHGKSRPRKSDIHGHFEAWRRPLGAMMRHTPKR
jgi:hypothetical protein